MIIGIDASRAFRKNRTGIEEYSYQIIKNLAYRQTGPVNKLKEHQVILYICKNQKIDFELPGKWKVKAVKWPYFWTQAGLSLEMLFHPVDVLFIPAHTVPIIHARNTIVVIHGLEYEFCPEAYSFWGRIYMRFVIKNSCRWAKKIIAVSENTKKDLVKLYKVSSDKIKVVHNGASINNQDTGYKIQDTKYLLFIGRLEKRKNILGIVEAFEILKEKYNIPHKLILAGSPGYGFAEVKHKIQNSRYKNDIILKGFVSDGEKFELLRNAEVFLFPSFYEGFGLPIVEAQSAGAPVVTSNISSMPEVADSSAVLVDPNNPREIAEAAYKLISDENFRSDIANRGLKNVKRFSWDKCAEEISRLLIN
jgi:glycosyltransferase involved in cell wall biosynthesis